MPSRAAQPTAERTPSHERASPMVTLARQSAAAPSHPFPRQAPSMASCTLRLELICVYCNQIG
eukprot:7986488-Alexandrium_andersonii.AAC.1